MFGDRWNQAGFVRPADTAYPRASPCFISASYEKMQTCAKAALAALAFLIISCGGSSDDICGCQPSESASADYRHAAKHVPLPAMVPQEITVHDMLAWMRPPEPPSDALRGGRELKLFHIAHAFVQFVWLFHGDCDIHVEIADTPDKTAPRVIVETPLDSEYCSARRSLQSGLARRGIRISEDFQELPQPVPAEVLGLAFQDFNHKRGSDFVATVWELHPATVNLLP